MVMTWVTLGPLMDARRHISDMPSRYGFLKYCRPKEYVLHCPRRYSMYLLVCKAGLRYHALFVLIVEAAGGCSEARSGRGQHSQ